MKDPTSRYGSPALWLLAAAIFLSSLLGWFAADQYRNAIPLAEENLRGLSLSLSAAVETLAVKDPSLFALKDFRTRDLAYLALLDRDGKILYHSNNSLVGTTVPDQRFVPVFSSAETVAGRTRLGTGEEIYESNSPVHSSGQVMALRLALHTYRADAVIRRARLDVFVVFSLLTTAWIMGVFLYRFSLRAEAHRQEMTRRERLAQLGEMGAAIAHEIRNPLSGIKGYAQLLQETTGCQDDGDPAGLIVAESLRLERLVNDLLVFVRTMPPPVSSARIADVLHRSLDMIAADAEGQSITVTADLVDHLQVRGNGDELQQVFLNLFRNALQAMPGGGSLHVRLRSEKGAAVIEIRDTGHGIPEQEWSRVFVPFVTTRARGTGLGLAICRKIVEQCGGRIQLVASSANGTTFSVMLPLCGK
ncbi:MAG: ATP-binding protein [Geobacteraceae bacterium]|nr:ATP-binding protein [Geobacteraceae bacterium]